MKSQQCTTNIVSFYWCIHLSVHLQQRRISPE